MELHARRGYILDSNPTRIHSDNWRRRPLPSLTWTAEAGLSSQNSSSSAPEVHQWLSIAALFLARTKPFLANYTFQKQISSIRITLQMQKHYSIKIREPSGHRNAALLQFLPIYWSNSRALNRKSDKQGTDRRKQNVNGNWLSSRNDNLLSNSNQIGHIAYHKRGHSVSFETKFENKNLKNCLFSSFHLKRRKKSTISFQWIQSKTNYTPKRTPSFSCSSLHKLHWSS